MQKRYPEIAELIAREYLTGTLPGRLPGSARLADRFGVNQRTVMRALQLLEKKNLVTICGTSGVYPAREQKPVCKRNGILVIVGVGSTSELAGFIREKLATTGFRPVFLDFSPEQGTVQAQIPLMTGKRIAATINNISLLPSKLIFFFINLNIFI